MIPGTFDFTIVRGTTTPLVVQFQAPIVGYDPPEFAPVPFTDVHLTITKVGAGDSTAPLVRKKLSDSDPRFYISDPETGEVTWKPTPAESRALVKSTDGSTPKNYYEFEHWNGPEQTVYLIGLITAIGGANDDV